METILIYFEKNIDVHYKNFIMENLPDKFNYEYLLEKEKFNDFKLISSDMQNKKYSRAIIIDDYGSLPFMIISKFKNNVVAQVGDFHSAKMTMKHNNANVLSLGYKILAKENLLNIIDSYLFAKFEAGRHMVRINMMNNLLEEK